MRLISLVQILSLVLFKDVGFNSSQHRKQMYIHATFIIGLVRDVLHRVENLLNHPLPVNPHQYYEALIRTQSCLSETLTKLNHIYKTHVLLPEAAHWFNPTNVEKEIQSKASAAITLWILYMARQQTENAYLQV